MSLPTSCEHLDKLVDVLIEEPWSKKNGCKCDDCGAENFNQWVCLVGDCLHIGCSKDVEDHVTNHYKAFRKHCIQMEYESKRVWCYVCEKEVFKNAAFAKALKNESLSNEQLRFCASSGELESNYIVYDSQEWSYKEDSYSSLANEKPMGAVGLLNVGNTCYMNSVIQALSNTPKFTRYFLDCSSTIDVLTKSKNTGLSRSYQKLIRDMWDTNYKDYVVPNNILYGIRNVHPMFRGYHQHDPHEFLRCFMDQLQEELKQLVPCPLPRLHLEKGENGMVGKWRNLECDGECDCVHGEDEEEEENEEEENNKTCDGAEMREEEESNKTCDGAEMREEEENNKTCDGAEMREEEENNKTCDGAEMREEEENNKTCDGAEMREEEENNKTCDGAEMREEEENNKTCDGAEMREEEENYKTCDGAEMREEEENNKTCDGAEMREEEENNKTCDGAEMREEEENNKTCDGAEMREEEENNKTCDGAEMREEEENNKTCDGAEMREEEENNKTCDGAEMREEEENNKTCDGAEMREEEENNKTCDGAEMREEEECRYDRKGESSEDRPSSIKYRSVISDIFEGKLLSSVQCLACNRVSTRVETFQDLSLPIPSRVSGNANNGLHSPSQNPSKGAACSDTPYSATQGQEGWIWLLLLWLLSWFYGPAVTLHDCLGAFFSADELKDDNMYSCENCNELTNGIKYSKVLELPEVLCIHLKRFRHELMFRTKISTKVSFPRAGLDMRPYIHADCKSDLTDYHLSAVICHTGTAGGGHYTCIARNFVTNKWFQFDDQNVTRYSPLQVSNCEPYVLFYTKSNPMYQLRSEGADILEASNKRQRLIYISNYWLHRFKLFAEPGPLDNGDFLCEHGWVPPGLSINDASKLAIGIPIEFRDFIDKHFPGDKKLSFTLEKCIICYPYAEKMKKRQTDELGEFKAYYVSKGCNMYAISMKWFRLWQDFVHLKTRQPPPPIDNSSIILQPTILDSTSGKAATTEAPTIKPGSDYVQLNEDCWTFLHKKYGGGPEVQLNRVLDNVKSPELQVNKVPDNVKSPELQVNTVPDNGRSPELQVNTVPDNVKSLEQQKKAGTGKRKGKTNKKQNTNRIQDNRAALPLTQQPVNQNSSSLDTILDGTSGKAATTEAPTIKPGSDNVKLKAFWKYVDSKNRGGPKVQLNRVLDNVKSPELQVNTVPDNAKSPELQVNTVPDNVKSPELQVNTVPDNGRSPELQVNTVPDNVKSPELQVNTVPDNVKSLEQQKRACTGKRKGKTNKKQNTNRIHDNRAALPLIQQPVNQNFSSPAVYSNRIQDNRAALPLNQHPVNQNFSSPAVYSNRIQDNRAALPLTQHPVNQNFSSPAVYSNRIQDNRAGLPLTQHPVNQNFSSPAVYSNRIQDNRAALPLTQQPVNQNFSSPAVYSNRIQDNRAALPLTQHPVNQNFSSPAVYSNRIQDNRAALPLTQQPVNQNFSSPALYSNRIQDNRAALPLTQQPVNQNFSSPAVYSNRIQDNRAALPLTQQPVNQNFSSPVVYSNRIQDNRAALPLTQQPVNQNSSSPAVYSKHSRLEDGLDSDDKSGDCQYRVQKGREDPQ